jgi:hypothetical protein
MKSSAEVVGEMVIAGLRSKMKEEREKIMDDLYGKIAQLTFPNLHEALVLYFEDVDGEKWVRYESHPTPIYTCKDCEWEGGYDELPSEEVPIELPEGEDHPIENPTKTVVYEKCPKCESENLKKKHWKHPDTKIVMWGSHFDIGALGDAVLGPFGHRVKGLFRALWFVMSRRIKLSPITKLGLGLKVGKLLM